MLAQHVEAADAGVLAHVQAKRRVRRGSERGTNDPLIVREWHPRERVIEPCRYELRRVEEALARDPSSFDGCH